MENNAANKPSWGVPDWTVASAYPAPEDATPMRVWAWEFLRRSPAYRDFWVEMVTPFLVETYDGISRIDRDSNGNFWPYHDSCRQMFGVELPSPPQCSTPAHFCAEYSRWVGRDAGRVVIEGNQVAYFFDLERPLNAQFERALWSAQAEQRRRIKAKEIVVPSRRNRCEKYTLYLRIIDAVDAGARPKEIGEVLLPFTPNEDPDYRRNKIFDDSRRAAYKIRDGGFISLLD